MLVAAGHIPNTAGIGLDRPVFRSASSDISRSTTGSRPSEVWAVGSALARRDYRALDNGGGARRALVESPPGKSRSDFWHGGDV